MVDIQGKIAAGLERGFVLRGFAEPNVEALRDLLKRHKLEVARDAARAADLAGRDADILLIIEGLTQCWPLLRGAAVDSAKRLAADLTGASGQPASAASAFTR